jgi:hypothetical protein
MNIHPARCLLKETLTSHLPDGGTGTTIARSVRFQIRPSVAGYGMIHVYGREGSVRQPWPPVYLM